MFSIVFPFLLISLGMISTDGNHYPERLGTLVVINAPAMLSWTWKVIQGFLDDVQKAKIGIYGTDPNEWRPVLFKIIEKDQVPVSYGGMNHIKRKYFIYRKRSTVVNFYIPYRVRIFHGLFLS